MAESNGKTPVIELHSVTKRYDIHQLVWFEIHEEMIPAITRERQIKKWNRKWKLELIEDANPKWVDLWDEIL